MILSNAIYNAPAPAQNQPIVIVPLELLWLGYNFEQKKHFYVFPMF
jgi:hypothetical protein